MNERQDVIKDRYYVRGKLVVESPLIIGSGEEEHSDYDIIRDGLGNVFVPGTSLAGVSRSYLNGLLNIKDSKEENKIITEVFGASEVKKDDTQEIKPVFQSIIYFYDATIPKEDDIGDNENHQKKSFNISKRDGVEIHKFNKVAIKERKFDYEILEPSLEFEFQLKLLLRKKHKDANKDSEIINLLYLILNGFISGEIRLGAKTSRGFGKVSLNQIEIIHLTMDADKKKDIHNWIEFDWKGDWGSKALKLEDLTHDKLIFDSKNFTINLRFNIPYSVLIKSYNPEPGEADFVHLKLGKGDQEVPIIPGTSWAGAIRSAISNIIQNIKVGHEDRKRIVNIFKEIEDKLFGFVDPNDKDALKSKIFIEESSIDNNNKILNYTRNKVDRFTGGVVQGALFSEGISNQGTVDLAIEIKNYKNYEIGLILLALCELWHGLQPIGGTTSVGRGILEGLSIKLNDNGEIIKDILKSDRIEYYFNELANFFNVELKKKFGENE